MLDNALLVILLLWTFIYIEVFYNKENVEQIMLKGELVTFLRKSYTELN